MKKATPAQGNQVLGLILQKNVPCDRLQKLLESGLLTDLLEADPAKIDRPEFRQVVGLEKRWPPRYGWKMLRPVTVDPYHDQNVEELVKCGGYSYADDHINSKTFPDIGTEKFKISDTIRLIYFDRPVGTEAILKYFLATCYRSANIKEIIALGNILGKKRVGEHDSFFDSFNVSVDEYPIIALDPLNQFHKSGNLTDISPMAVYIVKSAPDRPLDLAIASIHNSWPIGQRFAAVRLYD